MKTIEERYVDKSAWGPGPWQEEPDKVQWQDEATGLPCLIVRGPFGGLCGYVGVPPGHPFFEEGYFDLDVEVHGGLTYASHCQDHICHEVEPGEEDNVWWLGFDCGHYRDFMPGMSIVVPDGIYRDLAYVRGQCRDLARQLAAAGPKGGAS